MGDLMTIRISLAEYHMKVAELVATQSTCLRRSVGAIAVKDNRLIATGRNGNVPGVPHCTECIREKLNIPSGSNVAYCYAVHAEINLLTQAALFSISLKDSTIFVTNKPCFTCMKAMASINPLAIVYSEDYPDELTDNFIEKASWRKSTHTIGDDKKLHVLRPPYSDNVTLPVIFRGGKRA